MTEHILIIKHGALGDMVLATGPMQAIRKQHPQAHITLMTSKVFASFMQGASFIDNIIIDEKPKFWQLGKLLRLREQLNSPHYDWVYDLQTSTRSTSYFKLFSSPKPNVSGLAEGSSHRHDTPERQSLHTIERQKQQLAIAGITDVPSPNLDWLQADISAIKPQGKYAILVPGGSAHRPEKRWPEPYFNSLAQTLIQQDITPILIGTNAEAELLSNIHEAAPESVNLCNQTSFAQLVSLARGASVAVGNDTGPMHMIAPTGCTCVVLFNTNASNPNLCAPRGKHVHILASNDLTSVLPAHLFDYLPTQSVA